MSTSGDFSIPLLDRDGLNRVEMSEAAKVLSLPDPPSAIFPKIAY